MAFPEKSARKNTRLLGYDYSQAGGYFITIVTQGRECLFGEIVGGEMVVNDAGKMIENWWKELPRKFASITAETSIVMPNHFHGIILIHEAIVGADLRVGPGNKETGNGSEMGEHVGSPLQNNGMGKQIEMGAHIGAPLPRPNAPLSQIVKWFKTMTTNEYIRGVKQFHWQPFPGKLWQRNYFEHIIRNEQDYERIFNYIESNPYHWGEDEENR